MKKFINVMIIVEICVSILFLTSCNIIGDNNEMNKNAAMDSSLTKKYDLSDLKSYFYGKNANEPAVFRGASQTLKFNDVNKHFPVEVVRPGGYSVYAVNQGGYYYVFWSKDQINEDNIVKENPFVYFSAYLPSSKDLSEFESLKEGISTAKDVEKIDPSFELSFLMSSGVFSYSFLNDDSILEIKYDVLEECDGYDDLIVKEITVISRNIAPSGYSAILSKDLP